MINLELSKNLYSKNFLQDDMEIELTKMSSKGQIVIPKTIRKKIGITHGELFAVSTENDLIVLKKMVNPLTKDDAKTLRDIKEAWKDIDEGRFKKMKKEEFLKEISKW